MPVMKRIASASAAVFLTAAAFLSMYPAILAQAQEPQQQIRGIRGEKLPFSLMLPDGISNQGNGFVRIIGLPPAFSLNRGFASGGAWLVSLPDMGSLVLTPEKGFEGKLDLTIELARGNQAVPVSWLVQVEIAPPGFDFSQPPGVNAAAIAPAPPAAADPLTGIGSRKAGRVQQMSEVERAQMKRAQELLRTNDIAAARLIFNRLSEKGIAEAAFALAQTYDADFLQTMQVAGMEPDAAMARKWYERAAALGDAAAAKRVSELGAR
jgi:hypothetical protein